jgi:hypothetical protein
MRALNGGMSELMQYSKPATYGKAIRKWDAVTLLSGGVLGVAADITPGTTKYLGVAQDYAAASKASNHLIDINPFSLFDAQDSADTTGIVATNQGNNINLLLTDGPPTGAPTEQSANELDSTAMDTNILKDMHLIKLVSSPDNAVGVYSRWEVMFNKHFFHGGVGVTGV